MSTTKSSTKPPTLADLDALPLGIVGEIIEGGSTRLRVALGGRRRRAHAAPDGAGSDRDPFQRPRRGQRRVDAPGRAEPAAAGLRARPGDGGRHHGPARAWSCSTRATAPSRPRRCAPGATASSAWTARSATTRRARSRSGSTALGNRRSIGNAVEQGIAALAAKQLPDEVLPHCLTRSGIDAHRVLLDPR